MKCISLWQPWATLMVIGAKRIETRSWQTKYFGPLAIHASKKWNGDSWEMCVLRPHFREALREFFPEPVSDSYAMSKKSPRMLPLGCIVGTVHLVGCASTQMLTLGPVSEQERAFGDFSIGRFGWITTQPRRLAKPIPFVGRQDRREGSEGLSKKPRKRTREAPPPPHPKKAHTTENKRQTPATTNKKRKKHTPTHPPT
ncbi:MAG: ASCH domain-containing protein, partial [Planctomycetota bacterium]|nr:ASCH domain-containing protein [Planctomycetota bacterium]